MNILGFDTSSKDIYIVLIIGDKCIKKLVENTPSTEFLLPAIDNLLSENRIDIKDISVIAPGVGPGSFTGSRVAIASAKAFVCADESKKLLPFSAFDAIGAKDDGNLYVVEGFSNFVYVYCNGVSKCITNGEAKMLAESCKNCYATSNLLNVSNFVKTEYDILSAIMNKLGDKKYVNLSSLEPVYLRASQAEIQLEEKKRRQACDKN